MAFDNQSPGGSRCRPAAAPETERPGTPQAPPGLKVFWFLSIDPSHGMRHGATLRYVNLSARLIAAGHQVSHILSNYPSQDLPARNRYLERLRVQGYITGWFGLGTPAHSRLLSGLGRLAIHPSVRDRLLASVRRPYREEVKALLRAGKPDICILSDRRSLFLVPELRKRVPVVIDWCDSDLLAHLRHAALLLKNRQVDSVLPLFRGLLNAFLEERFYGRVADANIVVSPVDGRCIDFVNRRPEKNFVIYNGVDFQAAGTQARERVPGRIIFTGTMHFEPNYRAAIWFIDRVIPILARARKDIHLVVAGSRPVPELLARASRNVTVAGFVPDLAAEIAASQLYVAPLVSGSGFKNKIMEALSAGTYVVATPMAVEFLPEELKRQLRVAEPSPEKFAREVLDCLECPEAYQEKLMEARRIVKEQFSWKRCAAPFIRLIENLCRGDAPPPDPPPGYTLVWNGKSCRP